LSVLKTYREEDESTLVRALANGNLLAFNALFRKYSSRLYHFSYGYLKSHEDSEELVQEVFTTIWEKRDGLREELSFRSYLFTIAFNCIRRHFRNRKYMSAYLETGLREDIDIQTSEKITYDSLYQYVTGLVDKMPGRRREIFIKSRFEGYTIREISEDMNISHKTVENQLTEALKFLRSNISRDNLSLLLFFFLYLF
jgi:RNA polymerase sigma-70 factor (ECF subfamily)